MDYKFEIAKRTFKTESGEERKYYAFELTLDGTTFNLIPRTEDKKLINYILKEKEKGE